MDQCFSSPDENKPDQVILKPPILLIGGLSFFNDTIVLKVYVPQVQRIGNLNKKFASGLCRTCSITVIIIAAIHRDDLFFHQLAARKINKFLSKVQNRAALDYYRIAQ